MEIFSPSVPEAVRYIVSRNPHLYACIKMRVLNYNAVADLIQKEVEEMVGKKVNPNTIVAALVRYANTLTPEQDDDSPLEALKKARFTLTTGVTDVTIQVPLSDQTEILKKVFDLLRESEVSHVNIFKTPDHLKIIMGVEDFEKIKSELEGVNLDYDDGYARLAISLPAEEEELADILNYITDNLYRSGIRSIDGFFSYDDIVLILREADASRAFDLLRKQAEYIRRRFME
ncbi:MAG: hypothetical protein QXX17_03735 [Conexivisphaerales archaeon]